MMSIEGWHMADTYYISESSYFQLLRMADEQGFTKLKYKSHKGLSEFLVKLSYSDFVDTRPDNIKEWHSQLLTEHRRPRWTEGLAPKLPRFLTLTDEAIYNYVEVALRLRIHLLRRLVRGGQPNRSAIAICGMALEALGARWITPVEVPLWIAPDIKPRIIKPTTTRRSAALNDSSLIENPYVIYLKRKSSKKKVESA